MGGNRAFLCQPWQQPSFNNVLSDNAVYLVLQNREPQPSFSGFRLQRRVKFIIRCSIYPIVLADQYTLPPTPILEVILLHL